MKNITHVIYSTLSSVCPSTPIRLFMMNTIKEVYGVDDTLYNYSFHSVFIKELFDELELFFGGNPSFQ